MDTTREYFKGQANVLDKEYQGSVVKDQPGDTGTNREKILKNWLEKHIPKSVTPEIGGKILDQSGQVSKQIDIIIYDNKIPRFGAYEKGYYFAEGTCAAISVKSRLDSYALSEAVVNLASVKNCKNGASVGMFIGASRNSPATFLFAYVNGYSNLSNLLEGLKKKEEEGLPPIDYICINKNCFIVYNRGDWGNIDDSGNQSIAPNGYFVVEARDECIWRLVLELSTLATSVVAATYDFQKYFLPPHIQQKIRVESR